MADPLYVQDKLTHRARVAFIPTLDGWRCVAISLVLFAHVHAWLGFGTAKLERILHYSES